MERLEVATPDGPMELRVFRARHDPEDGVILYMDAFGLRPELDAMAARHAEHGRLVLLPDLYHRRPRRRFPVPAGPEESPDPGAAEANLATTLDHGRASTAAALDEAERRYGVSRFGAVGHCMGARHALAAAAAFPERVRAASLLHGGRLVGEGEDSPHRLIPRCSGRLYLGLARDDETCPEPHQRILEALAAESGGRVVAERYDALHGWTFPERWCHDPGAAERAFERTLALFGEALA